MSPAAAATLEYEVADLGIAPDGGALRRFSYTLDDIVLNLNNEVNVRFDPLLFDRLVSAMAGPEFDALLLQPNNPPGTFGDLSLLVLMDNISGPVQFSVDAVLTGHVTPNSQPFFINRLDPTTFEVLETLHAGSATATNAIPEPSTFGLGITCMLLLGLCHTLRVRKRLQ